MHKVIAEFVHWKTGERISPAPYGERVRYFEGDPETIARYVAKGCLAPESAGVTEAAVMPEPENAARTTKPARKRR